MVCINTFPEVNLDPTAREEVESLLLAGQRLVPAVPLDELLSLEPELNLPLRSFQGVTGMDHVPSQK